MIINYMHIKQERKNSEIPPESVTPSVINPTKKIKLTVSIQNNFNDNVSSSEDSDDLILKPKKT